MAQASQISQIVEDIPPTGAVTEKSAFDEVMTLAGSPSVNSEIRSLEAEAGITSEPTKPFQVLDPNIKIAEDANQPYVESPLAPTQPAATEEKLDVLDRLLNNRPEPIQAAQTSEPATPTVFTQEQLNEMVAQARAEEALKWEKAAKMIEDFEKNPYEFQSKYTPALVQEMNVEKYVTLELAKEFGEEFKIIPGEVAIYNSESNKYLKRQMELENQALTLQRTAKETSANTQAEAEKQLNDLKASIMTEYGVSDATTFDPMWNEIRGLTKEEVFKRLTQHALILRDIDKVKKNIKQPVSRAFATPGVTQTTPETGQQPNGLEVSELAGLYSPERLRDYNTIR